MALIVRKSSRKRASAEKEAAKMAEEVAKRLHSFAIALASLNPGSVTGKSQVTPRNWWKLQAGRFKSDVSFPEFVARVRAARKDDQ